MRILITGDAGHLGHRIKKLLPDAGGYDIKRGQDILDYGLLKSSLEGFEVVIHCAGIPHPSGDPMWVFHRTNVQGTLNVCKAAHEARVRRVIYFSSTAWYGCDSSGGFQPLRVPVDETHLPNPRGKVNAYGVSKRMAEDILRWYGTNGHLEVVVLRSGPANTKGSQYPGPVDWRTCRDWRWGCLFTNSHPDFAAKAAELAALKPSLQYEIFNVMDRTVSGNVDLPAFMADRGFQWGDNQTVFSTKKAQEMLGWVPSE